MTPHDILILLVALGYLAVLVASAGWLSTDVTALIASIGVFALRAIGGWR